MKGPKTAAELLAEICKELRFDRCSCVRAVKCDNCKLADELERIYVPQVGQA
jgi:hypothetical protein